MFYLTKQSWDHYQHELKLTNTIPEHIIREEKAREAAEKGRRASVPGRQQRKFRLSTKMIQLSNLRRKHNVSLVTAADLKGNESAGIPSFHGIGDEFKKEELVDIVTNGASGGNMPSFKDKLTAEEIDQLTTWLAKQKEQPNKLTTQDKT